MGSNEGQREAESLKKSVNNPKESWKSCQKKSKGKWKEIESFG